MDEPKQEKKPRGEGPKGSRQVPGRQEEGPCLRPWAPAPGDWLVLLPLQLMSVSLCLLLRLQVPFQGPRFTFNRE